MNEPQNFGRWIKRQRSELDLTQEALADRVGCAAQTIRTIESGRRRPSREMAERLAQILEIPAEEQAAFLRMARGVLETSAAPIETPAVEPEPTLVCPPAERRSTLPLPANIFIGREHERSDLARYFTDPSCRLLTLVGTGGIGKSRLALEVANTISTRFSDGVVWVALATVESSDRVAAAIAEALGQSLGADAAEIQLLADLRDKNVLLILDSIEHLLDATALVSTIMQEAPTVSMLITSRECLRIQGEWVIELDGLALPREGAASIEQAPAVQLFLERARQMQRDFALTPANKAAIARICALLQGMPLGIELAAAWVRTLSCEEIATEIATNLDFLALADRDAPPRHRSLRAVFEHSWRLLTAQERHALARLAVFKGGCRREAARDVADGSLPLLASLVDKSLVRRVLDATGTPRYDLHELVRAYAGAKLEEDSAAYVQTRDRHRDFYTKLLHQHMTQKPGSEFPPYTQHDYDNIRHAWDWVVQQRDLARLIDIGNGMSQLYEDNGWYADGALLFGDAVKALESPSDAGAQPVVEHLRAEYGFFLGRSGHYMRARSVLERCLAVLSSHEASQTHANILAYLGLLSYQLGSYDAAQNQLDDARARALALEDQNLYAFSSWLLGSVLQARGAYDEARVALDISIAIWRAEGRQRGPALGMYGLSLIAIAQGDFKDAQMLLRESLRIGSAAHDRWSVGRALEQLGSIAVAQGDAAEARYLLRESIEVFTELDDRWSLAGALNHLGSAEVALQDAESARQTFLQSLKITREARLLPVALDSVYGLARLKAAAGADEAAAGLLHMLIVHPATDYTTRLQSQALLQARAYSTDASTAEQVTIDIVIDRLLREGASPTRPLLAVEASA